MGWEKTKIYRDVATMTASLQSDAGASGRFATHVDLSKNELEVCVGSGIAVACLAHETLHSRTMQIVWQITQILNLSWNWKIESALFLASWRCWISLLSYMLKLIPIMLIRDSFAGLLAG